MRTSPLWERAALLTDAGPLGRGAPLDGFRRATWASNMGMYAPAEANALPAAHLAMRCGASPQAEKRSVDVAPPKSQRATGDIAFNRHVRVQHEANLFLVDDVPQNEVRELRH